MPRKTPSRPSRKAVRAAKHAALDVIMQEPEETVHFPVSFGRIAMNSAIWGAVVLAVLALAVLSSAVFLMRDEVGQLAAQLTAKDRELGILSSELQKVRDQMFGEREEVVEQGQRIVAVSTESGLMEEMPASLVERDAHPILAVAGQYIYQAKGDTIVRRELKTGTETQVLKSRAPIVDLLVSSNGEWLAYSVNAEEREVLGETVQAFVLPITARGDAVELGPWQGSDALSGVDMVALSDDGKTVVWRDQGGLGEGPCGHEHLHRVNVANGRETGLVETEGCAGVPDEESVFAGPGDGIGVVGPTPDGNTAVLFDRDNNRLIARNFTTGRDRVLHAFNADDATEMNAAISLDGTEVAVIVGDGIFAVPVAGGQWREIGTHSLDAAPGETIIAYVPGKFLLTLYPSLDGRYAYRNLETGTIASVDGPFVNVVGWSAEAATVVLLEDTRE